MPSTGFEPVSLGYAPIVRFRLHHDGRHAPRQSKQTLQTLTRQLDRETIMHETLQLLSVGLRRQASARTSAESDEACQRKTKDRADGMRGKSAHCPRRDSNLYLWDTRPSCASDCTTTAGTPPVSRNKHFRHSPVSSIVKQSCVKHSNSYLWDRDVKHLQGPPLSRTRRVRERRKIELTV